MKGYARQLLTAYPRSVQAIVQNHFVDDMLDGVDTENESINW